MLVLYSILPLGSFFWPPPLQARNKLSISIFQQQRHACFCWSLVLLLFLMSSLLRHAHRNKPQMYQHLWGVGIYKYNIYIYIYGWWQPVCLHFLPLNLFTTRVWPKNGLFFTQILRKKKNAVFWPWRFSKHALPPFRSQFYTGMLSNPLFYSVFTPTHGSNSGNVNNVFNVLPTGA